ncbi:MAG: hypothetical protein WAR37_02635 [Candidatus Microsaccharimonas sp.]
MNPQNGQTPLDYLNQIAPQAPKTSRFGLNLRTIIIAAIAAILLVVILVVIANSIGGSRKEPWEQLAARLTVTGDVVNTSSSEIKNSQLRSLNSDIKLYITNTQRDLAVPLASLDINPSKLTKEIVAAENATGITERLEDGRLNAKFDSTYAREMTYQLATILALLQKLYSTSSKADTKAFLTTAYDNLKPTYDVVSDFSAANE